jgi:hypothetical protein
MKITEIDQLTKNDIWSVISHTLSDIESRYPDTSEINEATIEYICFDAKLSDIAKKMGVCVETARLRIRRNLRLIRSTSYDFGIGDLWDGGDVFSLRDWKLRRERFFKEVEG